MSTSPNKFANIIRFSIGILVLVMWAIIGLLFWIPLLARAIAYYCGFVVLSSFQEANLDAPLKLLNFSIEFYPSGFNKIFHSFYENPQPFQNNYPKSKLSLDIKDYMDFIINLVWTVIFWGLSIYFLKGTWITFVCGVCS